MIFLLTGFSSEPGFRVFESKGVAADKWRTDFPVRADPALFRGYGSRVQELPLLCRRPFHPVQTAAVPVSQPEAHV